MATPTRMRLPRFLVGAVLLAAAQFAGAQSAPPQAQSAQPAPTAQKAPNKINPEIQSIIDGAANAPPEFGADILIRLAESNKLAGPSAKIDLLTKAFNLAAGAEQPVKRAAGLGVFDAHSALLARAYRMNIDRLSLQSRAVADLAPLNAAKARQLFDQIQFPALAPVSCEERLSYDVDLYYEALGKTVVATPAGKDKNRTVVFLSPFVSSFQSHAQLKPAAALLVALRLSPPDLAQLANTFAGSLAQLHGDERSFANAVTGPGGARATAAIADLIGALDEKQLSGSGLLRAYRQYLVTNFSDVRCASARPQSDQDGLPPAIRGFNQQFRAELLALQIAPVSAEELKSARIVAPPQSTPYWQTQQAKKLMAELRALRSGGDETSESGNDSEKRAPVSAQVTDFLAEIDSWQPQDEPVADVFHEKSILYDGALDLAPAAQRSQIINSFVGFLQQYSSQLPTRLEWILPADDWLSGRKGGDDRKEVIQAFLNSGDPVLTLYARLERLEPRKVNETESEGYKK
ncbi:MAG TPA: hypothetical protein VND65_19325 [Candidatus Binatia bacterium]|nr:hypothetical protein [Candidatus Binatia bacterium]